MQPKQKSTLVKKMMVGLSASLLLWSMTAPSAQAVIIFQNDSVYQMESDNLQIDSDGSVTSGTVYTQFGSDAVNFGRLTWDIDDNRFEIADNVQLTGDVDMSAATQVRLREVATITNPGTACAAIGEVIIETSTQRMYVCSDDVTNAWVNVSAGGDATTLDGLDSTQFLRSDTSDNYTSGTLTFDSGTTLDLSAAALIAPRGAADPACTGGNVGSLFYNTTSNLLKICNGSTFLTTGPQDLESVFATDADKTLTTSNQTFSVNAGTGNINLDSAALSFDATTDSNFTITGNSGSNRTLSIAATNAGAGQGNVAISADDNISLTSSAGSVAIDSSTWDISAAGVASGLTGITSTGNIDFSGSSQTRIREVATVTDGSTACANAGELVVETSTNKMFICTNAGTDTWKATGGTKSDTLRFTPEYPNAVVYRDGSANNGTLTATQDATENYYQWSSTQAALNDIELRSRFALPADFRSTGNFDFRVYTGLTANTNNKVDATLVNITNSSTTCGTALNQTSSVAATWQTKTITSATINAGCTGANQLDAGDIVEVRIKLYDNNTASAVSRAGYFNWDYNS